MYLQVFGYDYYSHIQTKCQGRSKMAGQRGDLEVPRVWIESEPQGGIDPGAWK